MAISGKMGQTKAMKRAQRLSGMQANRKRDKANQRGRYHSEFKRRPGKRGYPRMKGKASAEFVKLGFVRGK